MEVVISCIQSYSIFLQRISSPFQYQLTYQINHRYTHSQLLLSTKSFSSLLYRQYFKFAMLLKNKCSQENTVKEHLKEFKNDTSKAKKNKEGKKKIPLALNINSLATLTAKRIHKASKSTIEPNDHRLFNSPIVTYGIKDTLPNNSVSFTHILEQNLKNHQLSHNECFQPSSVTNFQIKQMPNSKYQVNSQQSRELSNPSLSREKSICLQKRSTEGPSKSPMRLVNANKMNNTPKLKQCIGDKQKTFKQLLSNKQNEEIKLQCSQKLFKYLDNNDARAIIPQKNLFCGSAKSNLLSTCAINLSQRCEHQKLPSLVRSSKGNISNKSVIDSSSNHEIKQFFEEDQQEESAVPSLQEKITYLKSRINRFNQQIEDIFDQSNSSDVLSLIIPSHKRMPDNSSQIAKLTLLKQEVANSVQRIIRAITILSNKATKEIDNYISIIQDTHSTSIDWMAVQRKLTHSDNLRTMQCQNDILIERIKEIEQQLQSGKDKDQAKLTLKWQSQLYDINAKITAICEMQEAEQNQALKKREPFQGIQKQFHKFILILQKAGLFKP